MEREAMDEEVAFILKNDKWTLTDLPEGEKVVGLKWVVKLKYYCNGNLHRRKGPFVAKGYSKVTGVDFDEVYSLVTRIETVRVLLTVATQNH